MSNSQIDKMFASALASHQAGHLDVAGSAYKSIIEISSGHWDALHHLGVVHIQLGDFKAAVELIDQAVRKNPKQPIAFSNLGYALYKLGRHRDAVKACSKSLQLRPNVAGTLVNRGNAFRSLDQLDKAERDYQAAIEIEPNNAEYIYNLGNVVSDRGDFGKAASLFEKALQLAPGIIEIHMNLGAALLKLQRPKDALAQFEMALEIRPSFAQAWSNRGNALTDLRRLDEALASYQRALELDPGIAQVWSNRGDALREIGHLDEALQSYDRAVALKPEYAEAWSNRGDALRNLKRYAEALASYDRALELNPGLEYLFGERLYAKAQVCAWDGFDRNVQALMRQIRKRERAASPFSILSLFDDPTCHRIAAELYVADKHPETAAPMINARPHADRIRVGYFSADFREHAVSYLIAGLFEAHDRKKFEIVGFSLNSRSHDAMQGRVTAAFDRFIEVDRLSDAEVAHLSREAGIDVAVDLGGHTQYARPGIFAERCAPAQLSYIGYLGTSGAAYMDYLIADATIVQESSQAYYPEKIVYLPSYQVNDRERPFPAKSFTRAELGLPETGFVFCCFNNTYKVLPSIFDAWASILAAVPGSVLFLYADNATARENLRKEGAARGLAPDRLVFGERVGREDYLARYKSADLFLDTLPYNAGTTASDALWMGLPVLTCTGQSFASRVAASLLQAVGLPELVTGNIDTYRHLAVELAGDPVRLGAIRHRLRESRLTAPLFDTDLFARHIEDAYTQIVQRHRQGLMPDHIRVNDT